MARPSEGLGNRIVLFITDDVLTLSTQLADEYGIPRAKVLRGMVDIGSSGKARQMLRQTCEAERVRKAK